MPRSRYAPISDYALIGDCHGTALVCRDGSIDWLCLPRFDSSGYFCRLLDAEKGGTFSLTASALVGTGRRYLPDTNVLETTFITRTGKARVVDCFAMRIGGRDRPLRQLLRLVEGVEGTVDLDVLISPRFDYGSLHPWLQYHPRERVYSAIGGNDGFLLNADVPLDEDRHHVDWHTHLTIAAGERVRFSMTAIVPHDFVLRRVSPSTFDGRLQTTIRWWRNWVRRGNYTGPWRDQVVRSALALKLLTCAPTGAIIAAPTTSLPEAVGGERNWDYRYSWVRDATMTLNALFAIGHGEVATGFKRFLERATAGRAEDLQIMYGCFGERRLTESEVSSLDGYRGSRPVRLGNGAASQTQLDLYGELLDAIHLWRSAGKPLNEDGWGFLRNVIEVVSRRWTEPDHGLWETRGEPRHFTYSKAMCWLALDRGISAVERERRFEGDLDRWRATRDAIRSAIDRGGVDPARGCFVQSFGSTEIDSSLLRLPLIGFVDATDPRMCATVDAIMEELSVGRLLRRYRPRELSDGLGTEEGAFFMTSFWLVDVLTMQGRLDEAVALFEHLLTLGNDLGLFSEEFDPVGHELLGNFPQAFSHVSLITAAQQIERCRAAGRNTRPMAERAAGSRLCGKTWLHGRVWRLKVEVSAVTRRPWQVEAERTLPGS
jgi:GH15 family glucan-1,4-alpha-glucosidase